MLEVHADASANLTPRERLIRLVRELLGQSAALRPVPVDARLTDLGLNSLKMVNLMLAIEGEFNLTIPQTDITPENFLSVASIEAMVRRLDSAATSI